MTLYVIFTLLFLQKEFPIMKTFKKVIIPVTASALLLGACGNSATDAKEDTIISSKAVDVKVEDVMNKMGDEQIANSSFSILLNKLLAEKYIDKVDTKNIAKEVEKEQVDISDKDIKEDTKKGSHILIKVKKNKDDKEGLSDKDAKAKAEKLQKQVSENPDKFGEIAKKESMDKSSAKKDGSLGYVIKGQMEEKFEKALFKLKEGDVSKVVKTDYGYHVIKADKEDDFDEEKGKLKSQLIQQKVQKDPKLLTDAYKELLDEYKVD